MDFAGLDLRAASEAGIWVHLEADGLGPLYRQADDSIGAAASERPCRVQIRGVASTPVAECLRELQRLEMAHQARLQRAKDKDIEGLVARFEEATRSLMERLIASAVAGWENIVFLGQDLPCTPANVAQVIGPRTAFFQQVYETILERRAFLGSAKPN